MLEPLMSLSRWNPTGRLYEPKNLISVSQIKNQGLSYLTTKWTKALVFIISDEKYKFILFRIVQKAIQGLQCHNETAHLIAIVFIFIFFFPEEDFLHLDEIAIKTLVIILLFLFNYFKCIRIEYYIN